MRLLETMGYRNVGEYGGGLAEWVHAGLAVDKDGIRSVQPEQRSASRAENPTP